MEWDWHDRRLWVLMGLTVVLVAFVVLSVACAAPAASQPTGLSLPTATLAVPSLTHPSRAQPTAAPVASQPRLLAAPNIYKRALPGEMVQFKGLPLFNVTGPDGKVHLHLAAVTGGDVVCVFPESEAVTLAKLATAQPKVSVSMEGKVRGREDTDLIIDGCSIIP